MNELEEQIKQVARGREQIKKYKEDKEAKYKEWLDQNTELLNGIKDLEEFQADAENYLRQLTLKAYAETGNKALAKGVGIREVTKLAYEANDAYRWAVTHEMALKLDTSAFEKIAKINAPDFVTITTEPQATIATNLEVD